MVGRICRSEFALLYAYPGCLYMVVIANLCGAIALLLRHPTADERIRYFPRLIVASAVALMVYLQLMLPCIPQLLDYFKTERALGELGLRWHRNMGAHLLAGIPWNNSDLPQPAIRNFNGPPTHTLSCSLCCWQPRLAFLVAGAVRIGLRHPAGWIVLLVLLLPGPMVYLISRARNHYLYEWYLFFTLSGFVAFFAVGVDWVAETATPRESSRSAAPGRPRCERLLWLPPSRSASGLLATRCSQ